MEHCNCQDRVNKFTEAVGIELPDKPKFMTREEVIFCIRMVFSEMHELANTVANSQEDGMEIMEESFKTYDKDKYEDLPLVERVAEQSDAMVDAYYYMLNVAGRNGHNLSKMFDVVHAANMAKIDPVTGKCLRRESDGKILKPEGWKEPDVTGVIRSLGYQE